MRGEERFATPCVSYSLASQVWEIDVHCRRPAPRAPRILLLLLVPMRRFARPAVPLSMRSASFQRSLFPRVLCVRRLKPQAMGSKPAFAGSTGLNSYTNLQSVGQNVRTFVL